MAWCEKFLAEHPEATCLVLALVLVLLFLILVKVGLPGSEHSSDPDADLMAGLVPDVNASQYAYRMPNGLASRSVVFSGSNQATSNPFVDLTDDSERFKGKRGEFLVNGRGEPDFWTITSDLDAYKTSQISGMAADAAADAASGASNAAAAAGAPPAAVAAAGQAAGAAASSPAATPASVAATTSGAAAAAGAPPAAAAAAGQAAAERFVGAYERMSMSDVSSGINMMGMGMQKMLGMGAEHATVYPMTHPGVPPHAQVAMGSAGILRQGGQIKGHYSPHVQHFGNFENMLDGALAGL
jgi:hypothetical protein